MNPKDTQHLLAELFQETQEAAAQEEQRLLRAKQQRQQAKQQAQQAQEEARQRQAAQMLQEEATRQKHAAQRRTHRLQIIHGGAIHGGALSPLTPAPQPSAHEIKQASLEAQLLHAQQAQQEAEHRAAQAQAQVQGQAMPKAVAAAPVIKRARVWPAMVLAAAVMMVVTGLGLVGASMAWMDTGAPAMATYHKVSYAPSTLSVASVTHGFTPVPTAMNGGAATKVRRPQAKKRPPRVRTQPKPPTKRVFDFGGKAEDVFSPGKR